MIRVSGLSLSVGHCRTDLEKSICRKLKTALSDITAWSVRRRAIDARDKGDIRFVYTVDVTSPKEEKILSKCKSAQVTRFVETAYRFPGKGPGKTRPIVVGSGPAGLFCAYELAINGFRPILLERGDPVDVRAKKVEAFWSGGEPDPSSNVCFGEGGAGTFSDGKLATGVRDREGRAAEMLAVLTRHGAPERILIDAKPHLGTDQLSVIVRNMREEILRQGGDVRFRACVTELLTDAFGVRGVRLSDGEELTSPLVVLAIGHSARDTFTYLERAGIRMEAKAFAVGLRVEHPQSLIDEAQYGPDRPEILGPATYRLTHQTGAGRGVYSFCMCPGGYVVNASSEPGHLCVNGMSYSGRAGENANAAVVGQVTPADFASFAKGDTPEVLAGMAFQRALEKKAWELAGGCVPVQRFADFSECRAGRPGRFAPQIKGRWESGRLDQLFGEAFREDLCGAIRAFGASLAGYDDPDALLSGVESRTSSPVRILRGPDLESGLPGLFPCGEGAGYAGGIASAAIDGIRVAEKIALHPKMC